MVCNDTAKRVKGKWPCLHNGRQHLMMKFPDEGVSCTTPTPPVHSWDCQSCPTCRIISWFFSTNTQFSEPRWRWLHSAALQPTLLKLSVALLLSSFLLQSQHLERVLQHFALLHFVGWLSNESRSLMDTASWVTGGPWAQEVKVYASTMDAACQAQVINVVRNWVESRNVKWIICQFHCRYLSWHRWDVAAAPHMEAYNQIPHGIFKNDIEWTLLTFNKSNFDSDTIKIKEGEHTEFSLLR